MANTHIRVLATALMLISTFCAGVAHACPQVRPDGDLVVGARSDARPFTRYENGVAEGFAVDLWEDVAATLLVPDGAGGQRVPTVTIIECDTIDAQELALQEGRIDVIISPLTITAKRMESYDFSQQYISSGLSLAVAAQSGINFETALTIITETLLSSSVAMAVVGFLSFNLLMALLIRWLLFSNSKHHVGGVVGAWVRAGLEAVTRTIGLRGVGDDYTGATAKVFEIFLAVVGTALSATFLGIMTSAFVGSMGTQSRIVANQLPLMRVATLNCSTAQNLLQRVYEHELGRLLDTDPRYAGVAARTQDLTCTPTPDDGPLPVFDSIDGFPGDVTLARSWAQAMNLLANGKVDAVLGDWVALTYLSRSDYDGQIDVLPQVYRNEPYGWGISRTSVSEDLRRDIDQALINEMRNVGWRGKLEQALGAGSVSPN